MLPRWSLWLIYGQALLPVVGSTFGGPFHYLWPVFLLTYYVIDPYVGADRQQRPLREVASDASDRYFRWVTYAAPAFVLGILFWGCFLFAHRHLSVMQATSLVAGTSILSGGLGGMIVAHELIHKRTRVERFLGGVICAAVCFGSFKIEHIRGHHRNAGCPDDGDTARLGQSIYAFLPRAIVKNTASGFRLEAQRLRRRGLRFFHWENELIWWYGASCGLAVAAFSMFGPAGLAFFFLHALGTQIAVELDQYVSHYGLERRQLPDGRYEPLMPRHSWNSYGIVANSMMIGIQRHSDHHAHPWRRYQDMEYIEKSPELPLPYNAMFPIALIPPLWRRVMDDRVRAASQAREEPGANAPYAARAANN